MNDLSVASELDEVSMADAKISPSNTALSVLHVWADKGWLRRLDSAMATFMQELDPSASPVLLVCTAVLVQMEGRGHTCLPIRSMVNSPEDVLAWPGSAHAELQVLLCSLPRDLEDWLGALRLSPLVRTTGDARDLGQPLVLSGTEEEPLLYLRRYWLHEQQVAQAILQRSFGMTGMLDGSIEMEGALASPF